MELALACPSCQAPISRDRDTDGLCVGCLLALALPEVGAVDLDGTTGQRPAAPGARFGESFPSRSGRLGTPASFGRYVVLEPLGSGGMAEVFSARDPILGRTVAIKVMRRQLEGERALLFNLSGEARAASALSHPNIVTVHDFGEEEGHPFIVMELVCGVSLQSRLTEPLPVETVIRLGRQIADALAAAHEVGIVHRDVKPGNILIDHRDSVRLVDFGIAQLRAAIYEPEEQSALQSPGADAPQLSAASLKAGTIGYLAPEVLRGGRADHRSDQFALGVVLYEMCTGRHPFWRETNRETIDATLANDRPRLADERPDLPPALSSIIERCLAVRPEDRYRSSRDLLNDLSVALAGIADEGKASEGSGATADAGVRTTRRQWIVLAIIVFSLVLAAMRFGIGPAVKSPGMPKQQSFASMSLEPVTVSGDVVGTAISPDGRFFATVHRTKRGFGIAVRQILTGNTIEVVPPSRRGIAAVSFSDDGEYLYFVQGETERNLQGVLYRIPSLGGTPTSVISDIESAPAFSPDGKQMAWTRENPANGESYLMVAAADGSGQRPLVTLRYPRRFNRAPVTWSPDGPEVLLTFISESSIPAGHPVLVSAADGSIEPIGEDEYTQVWGVAWLPGSSGFLVSGGSPDQLGLPNPQIWLVDLPGGERTRITNDLNDYFGVSVNRDGSSIATVQGWATSALWAWREGSEARQIGESLRGITDLTVAREHLYYRRETPTGVLEIWRSALDGSGATRLIGGDFSVQSPAVPEDGRFIIYMRVTEKKSIWRADADGTNARLLEVAGTDDVRRTLAVSPDGTWMLFVPDGSSGDLMRVDLQPGARPRKIAEKVLERFRISPDGRLIAGIFMADDVEGRPTLEVRILPADGGAPIASFPALGDKYEWTPDGKELTFNRRDDDAANLWRQPLDGSDPQRLTSFRSGFINSYVWLPDGTALLSRSETRSDAVVIRSIR